MSKGIGGPPRPVALAPAAPRSAPTSRRREGGHASLHLVKAFTLVELLVVITIIVILLALLTPALDQAIYQAELAVCAADVKGIVNSASLYAIDFSRFYPHRHAVRQAPADRAASDFQRHGLDDRPALRGHFNINRMFNDRFVEPVDLDNARTDSWVQGSYAMWFGYAYSEGGPNPGMFKMGDRWEFGGYRFSLLVGDHDLVGTGGGSHSSHPDRDGVTVPVVLQDNAGDDAERTAIAAGGFRYTFSRWEAIVPGSIVANFFLGAPPPGDRGLLDLNFGLADGAVFRAAHVPAVRDPAGDDPVVHVPYHANGDNPGARFQVPRP